jgi:hypothetical protein
LAPKGKPQTKPTTSKPKTTTAKTSGKKSQPGKSSARTSRARAQKPPKTARPAAASRTPDPARDTRSDSPLARKLGNYRGPGRPKDTPDVWTPAHKAEVAEWIYEYTDSAAFPSEAEFCLLYGVRHQRIGEFPELIAAREYLQARRAIVIQMHALGLNKDTGARASYLNRMAANVGVFSMTEKSEFRIEDRKPINITINPALLENDPNAEVNHGE